MNGENVLFWGDKWIEHDRLADHSVRTIGNGELEKIVREFWHEERGWKWEEFSSALLTSWLIKMASVVLNLTGERQDNLGCWNWVIRDSQ